jgi:acyl-CoA thioesterase FadM
MYPVIRLISTLVKAKNNPQKLSFSDVSEISFRCRPWDLDMFREVNNGRILTLFDLGRFDLAVRSGLTQALKEHNWGLVVAGSTVRYRKRIRLFDKMTMRTQLAAMDERWVYLNQSIWVNGQPCCSALLRTGVTEKGRVIEPERVKKAMGLEALELEQSQFLEEWKTAELHRPWPPTP